MQIGQVVSQSEQDVRGSKMYLNCVEQPLLSTYLCAYSIALKSAAYVPSTNMDFSPLVAGVQTNSDKSTSSRNLTDRAVIPAKGAKPLLS